MWLGAPLGPSPSAPHTLPSNPFFSRSRPDKDGYPCGSSSPSAHRSSLFFYFLSPLLPSSFSFFVSAGWKAARNTFCINAHSNKHFFCLFIIRFYRNNGSCSDELFCFVALHVTNMCLTAWYTQHKPSKINHKSVFTTLSVKKTFCIYHVHNLATFSVDEDEQAASCGL